MTVPSKRFLIVDDDTSTLSRFKFSFPQHNFTGAADYAAFVAALDTARQRGNPFDGIVLDFVFPGDETQYEYGGLNSVAHLKTTGDRTPAVILSSFKGIETEMHKAGIDFPAENIFSKNARYADVIARLIAQGEAGSKYEPVRPKETGDKAGARQETGPCNRAFPGGLVPA